jgi:bifunctional DNase/RNase
MKQLKNSKQLNTKSSKEFLKNYMQKVKLDITGIAYSQTQSGSYVLTLVESAGKRKLPIVIGGFEAQAIAVELEKMVPNRPLTHDLIKTFCKSYGVNVREILIYKFHEGVFYSKIICEKENAITEIDSRTSDAIAVGVRFNAPIFTLSSILEEVGGTEDLDLDFDEEDELDEVINEMEAISLEELNAQLAEAIENEDYELASKLRDEINKRS